MTRRKLWLEFTETLRGGEENFHINLFNMRLFIHGVVAKFWLNI